MSKLMIITAILFTSKLVMGVYSKTETTTGTGQAGSLKLTFRSTGCGPSSLDLIDHSRIEVLFIGFDSQSALERKCTFWTTLHIPPGLQVSLMELQIAGIYSYEPGGSVRMSVESFLPNQPPREMVINSQRDYLVNHHFSYGQKFTKNWSACGGVLTWETSIILNTKNGHNSYIGLGAYPVASDPRGWRRTSWTLKTQSC